MTSVANVKFRPGDVCEFRIHYLTAGGDAVDITGEDVSFTVTASGMDDLVLTDGDGLDIEYVNGLVDVTLTSDQTELLRGKRDRRYELRLNVREKTIQVGDIEHEPR